MPTTWYYNLSGIETGPVSSSDLRQLAKSGDINVSTLVRKQGTERWVTADRIKGLFDTAAEIVTAPKVTRPVTKASKQKSKLRDSASQMTVEDLKNLQNAANYRRVVVPFVKANWYGDLFSGLVMIVRGATDMEVSPLSLGFLGLGMVAVVSGVIFSMARSMIGTRLVVHGVGHTFAGGWISLLSILHGVQTKHWSVDCLVFGGLGGVMLIMGIQALTQYPRVSRLCRAKPEESICDRAEEISTEIEKATVRDHDDIVEFKAVEFLGAKTWRVRLFHSYAVFVGNIPGMSVFCSDVIFAKKEDIVINVKPGRIFGIGKEIDLLISDRKLKYVSISDDYLQVIQNWNNRQES